MTSQEQQHLDVGAYVLGVLDDAAATRFEEHLSECERCTAEFDALAGLEPLLAEYAAAMPDAAEPVVRPSEDLLDRLVTEVAADRRAGRRRRLYLVAAAAVLIIGGPAVTAAVVGSGGTPAHQDQQAAATDPATRVTARLALEDTRWGTSVGLTLGGVRGPQECDLIAVSRRGSRQIVTTWAVPADWGYGVPGHREPLTLSGGTALKRTDIARFEVRTLDGRRLVSVTM